MQVRTVPRDREWFARYFPEMRAFYDKWMKLKAAGVTHVPVRRARKEPDLGAVPRYPYPFVPSRWTLDRVLAPSGGDDEFVAATDWETTRRAALEAALDRICEEVIPLESEFSVGRCAERRRAQSPETTCPVR